MLLVVGTSVEYLSSTSYCVDATMLKGGYNHRRLVVAGVLTLLSLLLLKAHYVSVNKVRCPACTWPLDPSLELTKRYLWVENA